jgi:hypothetical protein
MRGSIHCRRLYRHGDRALLSVDENVSNSNDGGMLETISDGASLGHIHGRASRAPSRGNNHFSPRVSSQKDTIPSMRVPVA